jgi:hypothetical protein
MVLINITPPRTPMTTAWRTSFPPWLGSKDILVFTCLGSEGCSRLVRVQVKAKATQVVGRVQLPTQVAVIGRITRLPVVRNDG